MKITTERENFYLDYIIDRDIKDEKYEEYAKEKALREIGAAYAKRYSVTVKKFMYHDMSRNEYFDSETEFVDSKRFRFLGFKYRVAL